MQIKRYLQKDDEKVDYFGEHFEEDSWDFRWFIGMDKIGIVGNPSTEAECFMGGFLVADDKLIITPSKEFPRIRRESGHYARMSGQSSNRRNISDLIELIQAQETTHVYQASSLPDSHGLHILTFSPTAPPKGLYRIVKIMPVVIDEEALETERRYKREEQEMRKTIEELRVRFSR